MSTSQAAAADARVAALTGMGGILAAAVTTASATQALRTGRDWLGPGGSVPLGMSADVGAALDLLVALALLSAGVVVGAWYACACLAVCVVTIGRGFDRRWPAAEAAVQRWAPPALRRLTGAALGTALGVGLGLAPATAGSASPPDDLRWSPPAAAPLFAAPIADAVGVTHVVRPGESLWGIATTALGARGLPATDPAVAAEWPRWYAANSTLIGPDPDLIRPGQILTPPVEGPLP